MCFGKLLSVRLMDAQWVGFCFFLPSHLFVGNVVFPEGLVSLAHTASSRSYRTRRRRHVFYRSKTEQGDVKAAFLSSRTNLTCQLSRSQRISVLIPSHAGCYKHSGRTS